MKIRRRNHHVAQARGLERRDVSLFLGDQKATNYRRVTLNGSSIDVDDLPRIDPLLRLTCQRDYVVSNDADADVVEIVIDKKSRIALFLCDRVAFVTTGLRVEKLPALFSGAADCVLVAGHEVIEGNRRKTVCARKMQWRGQDRFR